MFTPLDYPYEVGIVLQKGIIAEIIEKPLTKSSSDFFNQTYYAKVNIVNGIQNINIDDIIVFDGVPKIIIHGEATTLKGALVFIKEENLLTTLKRIKN